MYLEKLEISGFKSFAAKTVLKFTPGITCIVGPNGSGKSNIVDAIRWVLGEQSLKLLRGKKAEDVIFSGSDKKARLGMSQVDLYLDNEDRKAPIDYSQIVITRRIFRNGESEYSINKNKVRLQDILLFLAKSHFGQRSYSIISQGAVDSILSAPPQERKNFFDEAAGVRQYQIKKEQSRLKLDHSQENLRQAEGLIQEIEPRLKSLTRQVRKLRKREEIEKELREIQGQYYRNLWSEIQNQVKGQNQELAEKKEVQESLEAEVLEVQKGLGNLSKEESRSEIFQKLQQEYDRIIAQKNNFLREQVVLKGKLEIEHRKSGSLNLVWLERRKEDLEKEIDSNQGEIANLKKVIEDKRGFYDQKLGEQKKVVKEFEKIEQELLIAKDELQAKTVINLPEIQQELDFIYNLQKDFLGKLKKAESLEEVKKLERKAEKVEKSLEKFKERLQKSSSTADPSRILALQKELSDFLKTKDSLVNEINELRLSLEIKEARLKILWKIFQNSQTELEKIKNEIQEIQIDPRDKSKARAQFEQASQTLEANLKSLDLELKKVQEKIDHFNREEQKKKEQLFSLQKEFQRKQSHLNNLNSEINEIKVKLARLAVKKEDLEREMRDELPVDFLESIYKSPLVGFKTHSWPREELSQKIQKFKHQLELIGGIDPETITEHEEVDKRYNFLTSQVKDLKEAIKSLEKVISKLDEKIKKQFHGSFERINKEFERYFKLLFNGGRAKLLLLKEYLEEPEELEEDSEKEEVEEEASKIKTSREKIVTGVDIQAIPPGKKLKSINMLSGGERALTSIALICAILASNPFPFAVLDEVDAALDEANSVKFAEILKRLSQRTQFIMITHNRATMQKASIIYGVTMRDDGISKLLSVNMEEAEKMRSP